MQNKETRPLAVMDGKTLLEQDFDPPKFIINRLMPTGLHLLAGSPKVGKSWLALWLCHQVSKGEPVWEFETQECAALYISLEDTLDRLYFRLSRITEDGSEQSYFAVNADNLSGALIEQLDNFMRDYPKTGLIVIDTFQRIREVANDKTAYAGDYEEINKIKAVADKYKIAVLLVHHLRKMPDSDPFNMVSGSTGIIGAADSIYILEKERRTDTKAKLHVTGRDIEDMQILLEFDRTASVWKFISFLDSTEKQADKLTPALIAFLAANGYFIGTATELLNGLKEVDCGINIAPNALTRTLKEQILTLRKKHGVNVVFSRSKAARTISLSLAGDDDGKNICSGSAEISSSGDGVDSEHIHI